MVVWIFYNVLIVICKVNKVVILSNLIKFGFWASVYKFCCFIMFRKDVIFEIYRYIRFENGICGYVVKVLVLN